MPIRTRTTTNFFDAEKEDSVEQQQFEPVSIGSANKPVHWNRAQKTSRRPTERPTHSFKEKKVKPVVDGSDSFLGVLLPRPTVSVTRSSYSDLRPRDVRATQDFKRPPTPKSSRSGRKPSDRASDLFEDGLAPDFPPIELVSVTVLFSETESDTQQVPPAESKQKGASTVDDVTAGSIVSTSAPSASAPNDSSLLAPPTPEGTPRKRKSGFFPRLSSRLSFRSVSEVASPIPASTPVPPLPEVASADTSAADNDDLTSELAPPRPGFLRESQSTSPLSRSRETASNVGSLVDRQSTVISATTPKRPASSVAGTTRKTVPPSEVGTAVSASKQTFRPKMTTILSRFSSRQMGDHKCKRGYPIAVFCGAQSMDIGSITNPKIEGGFALFFGPGHPANLQQTLTDHEKIPSHLHNPKPPTTAGTARRAELIATTRALQAIHDLYQGKACAHVCMDSPYVAKAWGSWIPNWEENGWPGDEHSRPKKDSVYQDSGDHSVTEEEPRKRSNKRLADEDLLRQLAAIRRLYARAERKGTGAAHLYLVDRNSNPANKTARIVLENSKATEFASPTHSPVDSRRNSLHSPRGSMYGSPKASRHRSVLSQSSRRSSRDLLGENGTAERSSRPSSRTNGRLRNTSLLNPAPPVAEVEENATDVNDEAATTGAAAATAAPLVAARPPSVKSAASAVTALSDHEDDARPTAALNGVAADDSTAKKALVNGDATKLAVPNGETESSRRGSDGFLAAAAASAAAFVAGVTGTGTSKSDVEEHVKAAEPELAVPDEPVAAPEPAAATDKGLAETEPTPAASIQDPGVAVPEEPEVTSVREAAPALALAPVAKSSEAAVPTPKSISPVKTKPAVKTTGSVRDSPASPTGPAQRSPLKARKAESPASPLAAAKGDKSGRIINYSARKRLSMAKEATPVVATDVRTTTDSSAEDERVEPIVAEVDESAPTGQKSRKVAAGSLTAAALSARSNKPTGDDEGDRTTPVKVLKKQQSLPATRNKATGDRESVISSSSSMSRRFRTLSQLGRSRSTAAAAPEEELASANEADKKARRKTMKWFKKEDAPPLPTATSGVTRDAKSPGLDIDEDGISELSRPGQRMRGNSLAARGLHRRQPTEQSIFEDDDEDEVAVAPPTAATKSPKSKKAKAPKPAKEPKPPKEPKEPFSFKRSVGRLMTME